GSRRPHTAADSGRSGAGTRCVARRGDAAGRALRGSVRRTRAGVVHRRADLPEYERGRVPALPELSARDFSGVGVLSARLAHADSAAFIPIIGALDALARSEEQAGSHEHDVNTALLLVVDQLEELFGLAEEVIARFSKLLDLCVRCKRVRVIATLRAD